MLLVTAPRFEEHAVVRDVDAERPLRPHRVKLSTLAALPFEMRDGKGGRSEGFTKPTQLEDDPGSQRVPQTGNRLRNG